MRPEGLPIRSGDVLAGKYRLERVLGEGGMGVVFVGLHVSLEDRVAIKVLHPRRALDPQIVTRFLREAKTGFKLRSEHVARTLDVGTHGDLPYIVMELLDGQELSHRIDSFGALPVAEAIDLVLQACEALASAHALGVVHRDLKPSNLFLIEGPDGKPFLKVLDFGISKVNELADATPGVTTTDAVLGSPGYMPPEQLRASRDVDARADIWSLAMVLWEMLVGKPMFTTENFPEICGKVLHGKLPTPREAGAKIPEGLENVIMRALAREPDARHPTVLAFAEALAPFLGQNPSSRLLRIGNLSKTPAARGSSVPPISPELAVASTATSHPPHALKRTTTPTPWGVTESRVESDAQPGRGRGRTMWIALGLAAVTAGALTLGVLARAHHGEESRAAAPSTSIAPPPSAPPAPTVPASVASAPVVPSPPASVVEKEEHHARPVAHATPSASASAPAASASSRTSTPNGAPILW
ncbi:MAG TPA: serine/threonine-protein kinase [Polyangiaceae bacterium]|jgi:serine/threonine-protein kinase